MNSKTTRQTHKQRTALSDARMFAATQKLILKLGPQKTTLKDVGELAGYSRGLANSRFGNKDNLFLALSNVLMGTWISVVQEANQDKTGLAAIHARLDATADFTMYHSEQARVLYILSFESVGTNSRMNDIYSRFHMRTRRDIASLVKEGIEAGDIDANIDAETFAIQFCSTFFGMIYQWVVNPKAFDVPTFINNYRQQMLKLLC